jgi:hypothetical protein
MNSKSEFKIDLNRKPNSASISNSDDPPVEEIGGTRADFSLRVPDTRPFCEKPRSVTNGRVQSVQVFPADTELQPTFLCRDSNRHQQLETQARRQIVASTSLFAFLKIEGRQLLGDSR